MKVFISRHARRQMKWRDVSEQEVNEVLVAPDIIFTSMEGRKKARKRVGGRDIEVVFKQENDLIVVITAIDKSR